MRLEDDIDFTTLNWVKTELDDALARARESLEAYVASPGHDAPMRECAGNLHQVQGTLRMVELYGAAMVVQEMERLVEALLADRVDQRDEAYAALMRGLMQMPDYLERLQSGHRDIPIVLLPLLNELRASRGEQSLNESALFTPNLELPLPAHAPGAASMPAPDAQKRAVTQLRLRFQQPLLAWFRGKGGAQSLAAMRDTMDAIAAQCHTIAGRRLWWVTAGVLDGLLDGSLEDHGAEVKQLIGRVDRSIRQLIERGESGLADGDAADLARELLYYVAQARPGSVRLDEIARTYQLDRLLPGAAELEHARGSLTGHNRALLDTVSHAIKEDLLRVKDALDLFLRQRDGDPGHLSSQAEVLDRVADTLGMLGLNVPRRVVSEQRRIVQEIASRTQPPDEDTLLDVAGALLYVEASLDDHIERLGAEGDEAETDETQMLPRSEARQVLEALMREAVGNLGKVKDAIVAFIESPWDHAYLEGTPALLGEIAGALRMLSEEHPAGLLDGIGRFVDNELVIDRRIPTAEQMDKLADALASIEYYLEAAREHRGGLQHILDVTEQSLRELGYWPVPPRREAVVAEPAGDERPQIAHDLGLPEIELDAPASTVAAPAGADAANEQDELDESVSVAPGRDLHDLVVGEAGTSEDDGQDLSGMRLADTEPTATPGAVDWMEIEEEIEEDAPVADPMAAEAGFQGTTDEIDAEIREVFLEEVEEEIEGLRGKLEAWLKEPTDHDRLTPIRRAFHTLKGSGRLVGARVLGEFSWKIENLLNRVLDGSVEPHAGVRTLVERAVEALPQMLAALRGDSLPTAPLSALMDAADRLAAGEEFDVAAATATRTERVRRTVTRRVPRVEADAEAEAGIPTATLAEVEPQPEPEPAESLPGPALPPMDPVLLDILRSEIAQHLQTIRTALVEADGQGLTVDEPILRAAHTLNGAIAMVEVPVLAHVLSPLEGYLKRLRAMGERMPPEGLAALGEAADLIEHVATQFDAPHPQLPDSDELGARLAALRDALPEPNLAHVLYHGMDQDEPEDETVAGHDEPVAEAIASADAHAADESAEAGTAGEAERADEVAAEPADAGLVTLADAAASDEELDLSAALAAAFGAGHGEEDTAAGVSLEDASDAGHDEAGSGLAGAEINLELGETEMPADGIELSLADAVPDAVAPYDGHAGAPEQPAEDAGGPERIESVAATGAEATDGTEEDTHAAGETSAIEPEVPEAIPEADTETEAAAETPAEAEAEWIDDSEAERTAASASAAPEQEPAAALGALPADFAFPDDPQPDGPLDIPELDADLLEIFVEEGRDILDHADSVMARLREAPQAREHVVDLKRDLHTLKGGARMALLGPIADLGHVMETLLEAVDDGHLGLDAVVVESLERGFDRLHTLIQRVAAGQAVARPDRAVAHFEALASGQATADDATTEVPAEAVPAETPAQQAAPDAQAAPRAMPELLPEPDELQRAPQEMIRVRADLLDSLVNYAGEVSIYRSRLEQQVSSFRFNLVEFEQTVQRLRDQLRKLEIETEAQIIARYQREHHEAGEAVFDPLELDRFSQLQQYSRALAESVSDLVSLQTMLDDITRQSETLLLQQSRVSSDLQEGLMRTRMVPFDSMVPTLRRTLRQAAQEVGKRAQLRVSGAHGEMDRNLLERMKAPFEHMLRNALAHGIESPAERAEAGKPEEGTVSIDVSRDATEVVIRVRDDGAGMDRDAIRAKAIERGLLREDANLSDRDLFGFILESGFSTAGSVTQLAGRGVGMDVVANEIKQMGGTLTIDSERGRGTTFTIRLPFTLAVTQAILVKIGELVFAVPMTSVQGVARIGREELKHRLADEDPSFTYAGEHYSIHDLAQLLDVPSGHVGDDMQPPLLLTRSGDLRAAVRIDGVIGSREIVVKSVGPQVSSVPGIFGATIMGDGSVVMILDLAPLVRHGVATLARTEPAIEDLAAPPAPGERRELPEHPVVMVVDDSITMRKVTGRVLERHDYEVLTAKDGLDAVEKLQERVPDLMLLDIEMPRMDGYELATYMKNDARLKSVPIIMITSRTGEKHRQRAFDIGVERYLGKPYQETDLIAQIRELLEATRV